MISDRVVGRPTPKPTRRKIQRGGRTTVGGGRTTGGRDCPDGMIFTWLYDGCIPIEFQFNQSMQQAFYYFQTVTIDGVAVDSDDWVGVFHGDLCVGAKQWDISVCSNNICDVPAMGDDSHDYSEGYMTWGDIPTFKIWDASENIYYNTMTFDEIDSWAPNNIQLYIGNLNGGEGITYPYDFDKHNNLVSFPLDLGVDSSIESVFGNNPNYVSILGEGTAAQYTENGWIGSLTHIDPLSGYWVVINDPGPPPETLDIFGQPIGNPTYDLHSGYNLISFPGIVPVPVNSAFPDDVAPFIFAVSGEGQAALNTEDGWTGSLISLEPQKGYWVSANEAFSFQFNLSSTSSTTQTFQYYDFNLPALREMGPTTNIGKLIEAMKIQASGTTTPIKPIPKRR